MKGYSRILVLVFVVLTLIVVSCAPVIESVPEVKSVPVRVIEAGPLYTQEEIVTCLNFGVCPTDIR